MAARYPDEYDPEEEWETQSESGNEFFSEAESNGGKPTKLFA